MREQVVQSEEGLEVGPKFMMRHQHVAQFDVGGDVEGEGDWQSESGEGEELLIVFKY